MKGPLYECVIDAKLKERVSMYWKEGGEALIYTFLYEIEIDESTYTPDYYVQWNFGKPTTVSKDKYQCLFPFLQEKKETPLVGLEPTTVRYRYFC